MSTFQQTLETTRVVPDMANDNSHWYAVHTRARHEKVVVDRLAEQGINSYLPLVKETHRWTDRKKIVELPLFSCYVFARFTPTNEDRLRVSRTNGVLQVIGMQGEVITLQEIYRFKEEGQDKNRKVIGQFQATGFIPTFIEDFEKRGIKVPRTLFAAAPQAGPNISKASGGGKA